MRVLGRWLRGLWRSVRALFGRVAGRTKLGSIQTDFGRGKVEPAFCHSQCSPVWTELRRYVPKVANIDPESTSH